MPTSLSPPVAPRSPTPTHVLHRSVTPARSSPYAAPRAPLAEPELPRLRHERVIYATTASMIVLFGGAWLASEVRAVQHFHGDIMDLAGLASLLLALSAVGMALVHALRALYRARRQSIAQTLGGLALAAVTGLAATFALATSMAMAFGSGRGRQLRHLGRPQHARVHDTSPWIEASTALDADVALTDVAEAWRANGQTEHASVAAFAELSLELVALGAPPALVTTAHHDALDELRHTELCFGLAQRLDGRPRGPRDFAAATRSWPKLAPRALRLSQLAVGSLYDGALYEGMSARVVSQLARVATDPGAREVLREIARDEARHAAHGFEVVRWCLAEGGAPVARALLVATDTLRRAQGHTLTPDPRAADGRWEPWGIPSAAREAEAWSTMRQRIIARTERLVHEAADAAARTA